MSEGYRLEVTRAALADFDREYSYSVRRFGQEHAKAHFARFVDALRSLASLPLRCRPCPGLGPGWRILDFDGLHAAYHVVEAAGTVTVAGILGRDRYHQLVEIVKSRRFR